MKLSTKKITTIGMLCAMALVINLLIHIPIVPAVSFLRYDPKDIVIVIGGFLYGPMVSFIMSAVTSILEIAMRGGTLLDVLMNMISTCTFACSAAYVYHRHHVKAGALCGLAVGCVFATISMLAWNYVITPIYFGIPREAVLPMLLPGILPFNLLKCTLNAGAVLFLYQPVVHVFTKTSLMDQEQHAHKFNRGMIALGGFLCATVVVFILGYQGIL